MVPLADPTPRYNHPTLPPSLQCPSSTILGQVPARLRSLAAQKKILENSAGMGEVHDRARYSTKLGESGLGIILLNYPPITLGVGHDFVPLRERPTTNFENTKLDRVPKSFSIPFTTSGPLSSVAATNSPSPRTDIDPSLHRNCGKALIRRQE